MIVCFSCVGRPGPETERRRLDVVPLFCWGSLRSKVEGCFGAVELLERKSRGDLVVFYFCLVVVFCQTQLGATFWSSFVFF